MTSPAFQALAAAVATACGVPEPRRPSGRIDWSELVRLVDRHHVAGLVHRSGWLVDAAAPSEARAAVSERVRSQALRSLRAFALQRDVLAALAGAGVDAAVLKGSALGAEAYGEPWARAAGDVDLLTPAGGVTRAVQALESAGLDWYGWSPPEDPDRPQADRAAIARPGAHPLLRDVTLARDGVQVEIHWRLFENSRLLPVDPAWLAEPRWVEAGGTRVPTLPLPVHWLYVTVHGARHLWSWLKWLADVPALALRRPELVERDALAATSAGYERPVATALLVAEAVFGRFLAPEARAWAAGVGGTALLVRRSLAAVAAEHDRPRVVSPRALPGELGTRLALRRDARYRLDELRLILLTAGRAHGVEDPGLAELVEGPLRWVRRSARRLAGHT